jgi:hypothetical protein
MPRFGTIPPEPPASSALDQLAPGFAHKLDLVIAALRARGWSRACILESFRTDEREAWLFGFGRDYDDDRGIVTNARDGRKSWHRYGLGADFGLRGMDTPPAQFYRDLTEIAESVGLTSGRDWNRNGIPDTQEEGKHFCDGPHVQWWCTGMKVTPSDHAWDLLQSQGVAAVWRELHADE